MITPHHIEQTHQFMAALAATCRDRRLPLPAIREVQLAQRHGRTFSFAIFPDAVGGKLEAYQQAGFLHQLSTTLKGQPVTYSNHTGFRIVTVIEDVREVLPARLESPEHLPEYVRLGRDDSNQEIAIPWSKFGHGLIVGMTGSGKSSALRAIAASALQDDLLLILADLHDNTFPMLAGHRNLLAPVAHTVNEFIDRMRLIREVIEQRKDAFQALHAQGLYPDDLAEFNAHVEPTQRLPRVIALFDEFSSACDQDGGKNGALAHLAFQDVTEARKFGINLIFSGQSISADLVGPMRDQITTRLCFRVARKEISRIVVGRSGAELIQQPGRALTERGTLQAYYFDKQRLIDLAHMECSEDACNTSQPITPPIDQTHAMPQEMVALAEQCLRENDGKFTEAWLRAIGLGQKEARRQQAQWARRGWIECDPQQGNAWVLASSVRQCLEMRTDRVVSDEPTSPTNQGGA
jgi:hypothetical protein